MYNMRCIIWELLVLFSFVMENFNNKFCLQVPTDIALQNSFLLEHNMLADKFDHICHAYSLFFLHFVRSFFMELTATLYTSICRPNACRSVMGAPAALSVSQVPSGTSCSVWWRRSMKVCFSFTRGRVVAVKNLGPSCEKV